MGLRLRLLCFGSSSGAAAEAASPSTSLDTFLRLRLRTTVSSPGGGVGERAGGLTLFKGFELQGKVSI